MESFNFAIDVWAIALVIIFAASLIQGLTGFGFCLVSAPILLLVFEPKSVVALNLLLSTVVAALIFWYAKESIRYRQTFTLAGAAILGIPLGTYVIVIMNALVLKLLIAAIVILFAIPLFLGYSRGFKNEAAASGVFGLISGFLSSSTSLSGPPVVLFLVNQGWGKEGFRASLGAYFFVIHLVSLASLTVAGAATRGLLLLALTLIPAAVAGFYLGLWMLPKVAANTFRKISILLVITAGVLGIVLELFKF